METPILDYKQELNEEEKDKLATTSKQIKFSLISRIINVFKKKRETILAKEEGEDAKRRAYIKLKAEIQAYTKRKFLYIFRFLWGGVVSGAFICLLIIGVSVIFQPSSLNTRDSETTLIYGTLIVIGLGAITGGIHGVLKKEVDISEKWQKVYEYEFSHAQDEVEEDLFKNSIKLSYKYLDQYYAQTREQAEKGFLITVAVAVFGAGLIFLGVLLLFFGNTEKITPAYITCASGAITEFISAIFFYLYNKTVTSMNSYHDKLVLSQNIAFALRIAGEIEGMGDKNKAKLAIINELVKDVNAQMMKSDADTDEPPKKDKPADAETTS